MKAVTITMPEELDQRASAEAARRGISKSELIRRGLAAVLPAATQGAPPGVAGAWLALAGGGPEQVDVMPGDVDAAVYGD